MDERPELNLIDLAKHFSEEEVAYNLVESIRWPNGPVCSHCGVINHAYYRAPKNGTRKTSTGKPTYRRLRKCAACGKQFSVLVGTIFEDSKIPLSKWLLAIHMMCADKNGVVANELRRTLKIAYRSAWFMCHRIRFAMQQEPLAGALSGTVEADETYVGGRRKRDEPENKTPVFTLVERNGEARSQVIPNVTGGNVKEVLEENVSDSSTIYTDESRVYIGVGKHFAAHETVNHSEEERVRGKVHTNTAEGFFAQLMRSLDGTFHHVSADHFHRYVSEFDFRYTTRKETDSDRTQMAIRKTAGKRLMYRDAANHQHE